MYIKELTNEEFNNFTSNFPYKSFYQITDRLTTKLLLMK